MVMKESDPHLVDGDPVTPTLLLCDPLPLSSILDPSNVTDTAPVVAVLVELSEYTLLESKLTGPLKLTRSMFHPTVTPTHTPLLMSRPWQSLPNSDESDIHLLDSIPVFPTLHTAE